MADELYIKRIYKQAYDNIRPSDECLDKIMQKARHKSHCGKVIRIVKPVSISLVAACMIMILFLPEIVKACPATYGIVAKYVPVLKEYVLPTKETCTDNGIVMQIEAVNVSDNVAEILISLTDEEGYDYINGKLDLYESYRISSYGAVGDISGCSFVKYDKQEDKAYIKIMSTLLDESYTSKLTVSLNKVLTQDSSERKDIKLSSIVTDAAMKSVSLNGKGGLKDFSNFIDKGTAENPLPVGRVADFGSADASMDDELTVMGLAYADGILRLQVCRGDLSKADRYVRPFLVDEQGKTLIEDYRVSWKEVVDGQELSYDEMWFQVEKSRLDNMEMYALFNTTGGLVEGDWEITIPLE